MRKPLLFDTQNPEISGFSTAHAYKYKTEGWQNEAGTEKNAQKVISHQQATHILEKHRFAQRR